MAAQTGVERRRCAVVFLIGLVAIDVGGREKP
jgi:hypothetical protein